MTSASPGAAAALVVVGFVAALVAGWPTLVVLRRALVLDLPNHRSSHRTPTPRGGGLAVVVGLLLAGGVGLVLVPGWPPALWSVLAGALALGLLGLADDRHGLPAQHRLAGQALIGAVTGWVAGGAAGVVLGVLVVPVAVNVVNFMDGIDGICAGHTALWGGAAALVGHLTQAPALVVLGLLTAGPCLGFLPWNLPRARMFLGDVGSYLLGGLVAGGVVLAVTGSGAGGALWVLLAPLGLFVVDTATTLVRRSRAGEPILEAHRRHTYQQLANEGELSHPTVVVGMLLAAVVVTAAALTGALLGLAAAVAVSAVYLASPRLVGAAR